MDFFTIICMTIVLFPVDSFDNDKHEGLLETRNPGEPTVPQDSSRAQKATTEQVAQRGKYEQKKYTRDEEMNNSVAQRAGYRERPSFDEDTGSHDLLTKEPDIGTKPSPRAPRCEEEISACGSHAEMFHGREPRSHEESERHRVPARSDVMQTSDQTEGSSMAVRSSSLGEATSCTDVETRTLPAQTEEKDNNGALISKTTRLNDKTAQARAQTEGHGEKLCRSDVQPRHEETPVPEVKTTGYEGQLTAGNETQTNGDPQMEELVPDELQQTVRGQGMSDKPTVRDQVRQKATETSESAGPDPPSLPELKVSVSVLELSSVGPEPSPDLVFNVEIPRAVLCRFSGEMKTVVLHTDRQCPCKICRQEGDPAKSWAQVVISTNATPDLDIIEDSMRYCQISYESENTDMMACSSVYEAVELLHDAIGEKSNITFVTHEVKTLEHLNENVIRYNNMTKKARDTASQCQGDHN